ncbi:hypothetical protein PoB_001929100 [Plakobranchus ocellatus]|uniref:Uncharacterized protein n=1 Tax=Plakobranchus ocellatus TaxID=259542 RepID=A0AAV3ZDR7_9GAST|nr:hypothetical protein PoB_001929100 [Plakobranchus ocellatus]
MECLKEYLTNGHRPVLHFVQQCLIPHNQIIIKYGTTEYEAPWSWSPSYIKHQARKCLQDSHRTSPKSSRPQRVGLESGNTRPRPSNTVWGGMSRDGLG